MPTPPLPRDGSSFARAIVVGTVGNEYIWIEQAYPGATLVLQMLMRDGDRRFDVLTLKLTSGEQRTVFFDVTDLAMKRR